MLHRVALIALLVGACLAQDSEVVDDHGLPRMTDYEAEGDLDPSAAYTDVTEEEVPSESEPSDETSASTGRNSPGVHAGCGTCDITRCEPLAGRCIGGYTLDACGCCPACSRLVGEYCNSETVEEMRTSNNTNMIWYGRCGSDLECVTENAFVSGLLDGQPQQVKICECKKRGKVCGTDGITYPNICALKATGHARSRNSGLQMRSTGSCPYGPIIVTKPRDVTLKVHETSNVMMCEASGYPIPAILWTFTRDDGTTVSIPSDDKDVSVITRGGQTENRVSSWVQIIGASKKHEGIYTCYAEISGTRAVQEDAQLTVSESD